VTGNPATPAPAAVRRVAAKDRPRGRARPAPARLRPAAQTKISLFAAALAESSWLAAVVLVPVFFNIHSERIFEEDKIPLLRSLALCALGALIVWLAERGRVALRVRGLPLWRVPLVAPAAALGGAYALATLASVNPRISFFGAYLRQQGTYTWLSYLLFFLAIVLLVRERRQIERIVSAMLLAGGVVALHTFTQELGYDPLPWGSSFGGRAYGPAGNPIFLGAFLIMVAPLTAVCLVRAATSRPARVSRPRVVKWVAGLVLFALLSMQLAVLLTSESRGPVVGLGAALLALGLTYTALRGWRRLMAGILGLALVGALFFGTLSFLPKPVPTGGGPAGARFARLVDLQRGSGKVRVLIWQAASQAFTAKPWRALIGYGPETFLSVVNPFYPPELAYYESRRVLPDRAHDATFDALITTGLLGCAAEVSFTITFLGYGLFGLGLMPGPAQRRAFLALTATGALAGAVLPWLADGSLRFSGVGLPLGLFCGLVLFLVLRSLSSAGEVKGGREPERLVLLAAVATAAGHLVETSVGIPIVATRLYFWVFAGLVVAIGLRFERRGVAPREASASRRLPWGVFVGLVLTALTYDIYSPQLGARVIPLLLGIFLPTWALGAFLAPSTSPARGADRALGWRFLLASLLPWASFAAVLVWWVRGLPQHGPDPITTAVLFTTSMSHLVSVVYVAVFSLVVCAAVVAVRNRRRAGLALARRTWLLPGYAALASVVTVVIVTTNLVVSRADIINKQASYYESRKAGDTAARLYEEALALRPYTDSYAANLGRVLSNEGSRMASKDPARAHGYLIRAQAALEQAYAIRPRSIDHPRNLARLHHLWAGLVQNPEARAEEYEQADRWYEQTLRIAPTHAAVLNEWALMRFERGETERAMEMLSRSLEIDPLYTTTYWIRGNIRATSGDLEGAIADYDSALEIDPKLLPALSGKGAVLVQLGRIDEAIAANRRALKVQGGDFISLKNLAVLYRDEGKLGASIRHAKRALAVAPKEEKEALAQFLADVEARRSTGANGEESEETKGEHG
jgi:tetratricopeptide (TPR) repeat protein